MRVHIIQTGRVVLREALVSGPEHPLLGLLNALLRPKKLSIPIHSYVVEHPDGVIMVDTGLHAKARIPKLLHPLVDVGRSSRTRRWARRCGLGDCAPRTSGG
jgi:hypothetical protein